MLTFSLLAVSQWNWKRKITPDSVPSSLYKVFEVCESVWAVHLLESFSSMSFLLLLKDPLSFWGWMSGLFSPGSVSPQYFLYMICFWAELTSGSSNLLDQRKPAPLFPAGEGLRFRGSEGSSLLSTMPKKKSYLFDLPIWILVLKVYEYAMWLIKSSNNTIVVLTVYLKKAPLRLIQIQNNRGNAIRNSRPEGTTFGRHILHFHHWES